MQRNFVVRHGSGKIRSFPDLGPLAATELLVKI